MQHLMPAQAQTVLTGVGAPQRLTRVLLLFGGVIF